ncbi:extracellular solute-binding protein [Paenibacillus albicereus]|uniref:Extracellular solute-binding protein n=1 Tax=Paenibacillus albicereus TaxID=2726185 RepID=A0A6H2GVQ8_9BACL|nr:extracellular solute-binding protein [Paenibacillus albicereus]QJC51500.1 extracellular solute-binding protein [Paenibacillus albicereus]
MKRSRVAVRLLLGAAVLAGAVAGFSSGEPQRFAQTVEASELLGPMPQGDGQPLPYARLMMSHPEAEREAAGSPSIALDPLAYTGQAPEAKLSREDGRDGPALLWSSEAGWAEWTFEAPRSGWYELHLDYKPLPGGRSSVVRGAMIDGAYPFAESRALELERQWRDAKYPYDRNEIGMQVRPAQTELTAWSVKAASDYAASPRPLLYRLEQGRHTLRLVGEREPVALRGISFEPQQAIPSYADYAAAQPAYAPGDPWHEVKEAEAFRRKSSLSIQTDHWAEPNISPDPKGRIAYNVLGGNRWRLPGEWVEWQLDAPADGWYELDLKAFQNYRAGFKAYRMIELDGQVPFREWLSQEIGFRKEFAVTPLAGSDGKPYRIYLRQGAHTLRLTADSSPLQPVVLALRETLAELSEFDRRIRLLTGNYSKNASDANIDAQRTWDMSKYDPGAKGRLDAIAQRLTSIRDYLNGVNGRDSDLSQAILSSLAMLDKMRADVNEIPSRVNDFSTIQANIGAWMTTLTQQPLLLDYLVLRTPDTDTGLKAATALSRVPYALKDFGRSFTMEYEVGGKTKEGALTIWVQRGRDYVDLLREMVEQDFTPRTGIPVNINLMTSPNQLILGNAAGEVPDVALGLGEATPADYAMRDAVEDLSGYPGFGDVMKRFIPGAARALSYEGGIYGLPEVQNFQLLFYRTDILERLGLEPPDTWEDVFDLLPTLQENGMTMSVPKGDFATFFLENGAEPYASDGLRAELDSEQGQRAFRQWTEMFTKYNLPIDIPAFFQHFRDGDIPIGIADFNTYVQLLVAAPDITGHWATAPLPGIAQESGEVVRWSPQGLSTAVILQKSGRKDAAWQFLTWWTSDEVQAQYAADMESFYGLEYRWNTANVNAMRSLPWPAADLRSIREQARWTRNLPNVPGYYFLGREMEFAWNRTVFDGMPAKESLEQAQLSLQREMDRRQRDFGIGGRSLDVPQVDRPFEWGGDGS